MTTTQEEQAAVAAQDRDAVLFWLRNAAETTNREARRAFGAKIMTASVFIQAHMEGLVTCGRCGDLGCGWCQASPFGPVMYGRVTS